VAPVVGQSIQQVVTCFLPTVAREVVHLKIAQDLAEKPGVALAIQGGLYLLHMGAEVNRHRRLKEHSDVAARAFHGLTQPQWDAKTPEQQAALVDRMLNTSIGSAALYTTATAINLTVSAVFRDDPEHMHLAGVYAARDVRNIVYAVGRDSLQAMFGMTSRTPGDNATNGVTPGRLAMASLTYGAVQSVISLANTEGIEDILPGGIELKSGAVLRANSAARNAGQSMTDVLEANGTDIHRLQFEIAFLRGATNAPGVVIDALQLPIHEAYLAGGTSHVEWDPQTSDGRDVTRLASHSVVRVDWNKVAGTADPLLSLWRPSSDDHTEIKKYTLPAIGGVLWGVTYAPVAQLYQAHASVRREMRRLDEAAQDIEMPPLSETTSEPPSPEMSPPRQGVDHPLSGAGGPSAGAAVDIRQAVDGRGVGSLHLRQTVDDRDDLVLRRTADERAAVAPDGATPVDARHVVPPGAVSPGDVLQPCSAEPANHHASPPPATGAPPPERSRRIPGRTRDVGAGCHADGRTKQRPGRGAAEPSRHVAASRHSRGPTGHRGRHDAENPGCHSRGEIGRHTRSARRHQPRRG
jgi:hypothetical protein